MCGLAGLLTSSLFSTNYLMKAQELLRSRGPDGSGVLLLDNQDQKKNRNQRWSSLGWHKQIPPEKKIAGALLQTRLSIRDLSEAGAQPMPNHDRSIWICYNGEIYDWEHKADYLRSLGYQFRSHCDTEFILHAYQEWGEKMLPQLRGMFAIAILDLRKQHLLLIRDRLGEKPLFYATEHPAQPHQPLIGFASGLRPLSALLMQGEQPPISGAAIDAYLTHRYIPAPLSIVDGIKKLLPGHFLKVDLSGIDPQAALPTPYWSPSSENHQNPEHLFDQAIDLRLASDRPVGLFLSGGIDSQAIAASLHRSKQQFSKKATTTKIPAITATFPGSRLYDESSTAAQIATLWEMEQYPTSISMQPEDLPNIMESLDEPFGDPSFIPTWYLCREARKEAVVALSGDGGDELFGGYKRYQIHQRASLFTPLHGWHQGQWHSDSLCLKSSSSGKKRRQLLAWQMGWQHAYTLRFSGWDPLSRAFLQPDFEVQNHYWRLPTEKLPPLAWMLACDRLNYLPEYILRKSDLAGMAHGVEIRAPFLDHHLVEVILARQLWKEKGKHPKQWLINRIGPQAIITPKHGFNPPLGEWLYHPKLQETLSLLSTSLQHLSQGQVDGQRLRKTIELFHQEQLKKEHHAHHELLWLLLVLLYSLRNILFYDLKGNNSKNTI